MFEIRFPAMPWLRSPRSDNLNEIIDRVGKCKGNYLGWVFVKNAVTGETIHKQFICG